MLTHQLPDDLRARIVELESSVDLRFSRHRGVVGGVEVGDTEIKRILRRSDDPAERRSVGGVEDRRRRGGGRRPRARPAPNEAARGARVPRLVRAVARDRRARRGEAHRDARGGGPRDRRAVRALEGRARRALASRFGCAVSELRPWHYADPFFQETPPDGAVDLDPLFADEDIVALARRTFEGIGLEVDGILAERPLPARGQEPARVLHRHRPRAATCGSSRTR